MNSQGKLDGFCIYGAVRFGMAFRKAGSPCRPLEIRLTVSATMSSSGTAWPSRSHCIEIPQKQEEKKATTMRLSAGVQPGSRPQTL